MVGESLNPLLLDAYDQIKGKFLIANLLNWQESQGLISL